jgi:hypothetical protein
MTNLCPKNRVRYNLDAPQHPGQGLLECRPLISAIGVEFAQEREQAEQACHEQYAAVAILNVGGMDDRAQQKTFGVDKQMPLLALDLLARIVAVPVDRGPPFSALLTLWLSMMAAVGLASRDTCSRHFTYSA